MYTIITIYLCNSKCDIKLLRRDQSISQPLSCNSRDDIMSGTADADAAASLDREDINSHFSWLLHDQVQYVI